MNERSSAREPSLYVHVPFCETKCSYCDFYSLPGALPQSASFVDAVARELDARLRKPLRPSTVFFGGGTPTQLDAHELRRLLSVVLERIDRTTVEEFTVEANPGTLTREKVDCLLDAGVTRISLGAQSFHEEQLRFLERLHDVRAIGEAVQLVRSSGLREINLDLIYSIPGQSLESWREDMKRAIDLEPTHVSAYALTFEDGTPLGSLKSKGAVQPLDEEVQRSFFEATVSTLEAHGYLRYEISNFAPRGHECRHNIAYWQNDEYYGIGPGAHSYLNGERSANARDLRRYIADLADGRLPRTFAERLTPLQAFGESIMLGLRTSAGISRRRLLDRFGIDLQERHRPRIRQLTELGFVTNEGDAVRLTPSGFFVADAIMAEFLEPSP